MISCFHYFIYRHYPPITCNLCRHHGHTWSNCQYQYRSSKIRSAINMLFLLWNWLKIIQLFCQKTMIKPRNQHRLNTLGLLDFNQSKQSIVITWKRCLWKVTRMYILGHQRFNVQLDRIITHMFFCCRTTLVKLEMWETKFDIKLR